jgi:hypothetical protein
MPRTDTLVPTEKASEKAATATATAAATEKAMVVMRFFSAVERERMIVFKLAKVVLWLSAVSKVAVVEYSIVVERFTVVAVKEEEETEVEDPEPGICRL